MFTLATIKKIPAWMVLLAFILVILLLIYVISTNREVHFWPNPSIAPAPACDPNACVQPDGTCGVVELTAGATYDKQSFGYDVKVVKAAPGEMHYSAKGVEGGMFVGASWQCQKSKP